MTAPVDPARCPLCGGPNDCAMAPAEAACSGDPQACWCTGVRFDPELLARIPAAAQRKACVCHACATGARGLSGDQPAA